MEGVEVELINSKLELINILNNIDKQDISDIFKFILSNCNNWLDLLISNILTDNGLFDMSKLYSYLDTLNILEVSAVFHITILLLLLFFIFIIKRFNI